MADGITLMIGTTKGAFLMRSQERETWSMEGPLCEGWPINHMAAAPETGQFWAGGGGSFEGAGVWRSQDDGKTWALTFLAQGEREAFIAASPEEAASYGMVTRGPAPFTGDIDNIWSLARLHGRLYAGTKPANLYVSDDDGVSFSPVESLRDHPSRDGWFPGGAGLTLHTIIGHPTDADRVWIAISAAGMFATEDGGGTWDRRNTLEASNGEAGACVHNAVRAHAPDDLLYQQNHDGVFRSSNGGRSWTDISAGLPSRFGFPIAVDPHDPDRIWTLPLNGDVLGRYPVDAHAKVWRSEDGGATWGAVDQGLPRVNCYFTVLRQAMTTDQAAQTGVYFGTNTGSIFASRDRGDSWNEIARHLPTVLCVECVHAPISA